KNDLSKKYNITPIVTSFSWETQGYIKSALKFSIALSDDKQFPKNPVEVGDLIIILEDNMEIIRNVVVEESQSNLTSVSYTGYDIGWWLRQSKSVYQFNNVSAKQAIATILTDFDMKHDIAEMPTLIHQIYIQKSPAEMISDIIKQYQNETGKKMYTETDRGVLYIKSIKDMTVIGSFKLTGNLEAMDITKAPLSFIKSKNLLDMRNRIRMIVSDNSVTEEIASIQDKKSIKKYGLIEETYKIEKENSAQARQVAKILLQRLNKVKETHKLTLFGDTSFKSGRLFNVDIEGITGRYMIMNAAHNVDSGGNYTMQLDFVLPEEVV
ncbi:MAG: hypothetical protein MJE63_22835, partial [Proteobacteria bacterium]|nr:hypothetical protein [Pseudomonadota bacterium]